MLEFRYDMQLLIEGEGLDEDVISEYFTENFKGDCLLAVGDEELIKSISIQMNPGRCWNIVLPWEKFMILLWKTWTGRQEA